MPFIFRSSEMNKFLLIRISVFVWCHSRLLSEPPAEMLRVLKTEFVSNLTDRLPCVEHMLLRHFQGLLLDMLQGGFSRFLFQQVAQIVG